MERDLGYRRIQRTGRGSYIISLPKDWVQNNALEKGSEVAFKQQPNSSMLLVPRNILEKNDEKPHLKEFTIHITSHDDPQSIARKIISLYTVSADVIRISINDGESTTEQKTVIKKTARMLLGSEIISETSREITIHVLVNHPAPTE